MCSDVAPIGGMERVTYELCSRLRERGWHLTVIARSCALPSGPRLRFVRLRSPARPVSLALACDFLLGSWALARHRAGIVQTTNPMICNRIDVLHTHFCEAAFRKLGVSRSRRPTVAYRVNSWLASWISILLERWNYRAGRVRSVVTVSRGLADEISMFYPGVRRVITTIPNGVDLRSFVPEAEQRARVRAMMGAAEQDLVALFVGGDWHRKGLSHAIDGIAAAEGWLLAVLGAGDRERFAAVAAERGVAHRVHFVGKVADPIPYFLAADALVAPSHYETFSLVALEAAAAGLPLIVSRVSGTEDRIEHGVNGWFTERDGDAIADRLRRLRDDPELRTRMGAAARRSAERYDWERITDAFEAVYAELQATRS